MPNLRIIYDNIADRATLTASTSAGQLLPSNMQTDIKSDVWRATSTTASIYAVWPEMEIFGGVSLPFCNLTAKATIRVRIYDESGGTVVYDSGVLFACRSPSIESNKWGNPLGANAYFYAGNSYATVWMSAHPIGKFMQVDLEDVENTDGYVEASRLICGNYWSPVVNAKVGATISIVDTSSQFRTDGGDLLTDIGTRHRKQTLDLPAMASLDRASMWNIIWGNGTSRPLFFSLYPESEDILLEQSHQMYCKFVTTPVMSTPYFAKYACPVDLEEI